MKKILFFGASHVAALKMGYESYLANNPKTLSCDFLGMTSGKLNMIDVIGGRLVYPEELESFVRFTRDDKYGSVRLDDYDVVVFPHESCLLSPQFFFKRVNNRYLPAPVSASLMRTILNRHEGSFRNQTRFGEFDQLKLGRVEATTLHHYRNIYKLIDQFSGLFVFLGRPLPSQSFDDGVFGENVLSVKYFDELSAKIRSFCEKSFLQGGNLVYALPPADVLTCHGFRTKPKYMKDCILSAGPSNGRNPLMDMTHGNPLYGERVVSDLLPQIELNLKR